MGGHDQTQRRETGRFLLSLPTLSQRPSPARAADVELSSQAVPGAQPLNFAAELREGHREPGATQPPRGCGLRPAPLHLAAAPVGGAGSREAARPGDLPLHHPTSSCEHTFQNNWSLLQIYEKELF